MKVRNPADLQIQHLIHPNWLKVDLKLRKYSVLNSSLIRIGLKTATQTSFSKFVTPGPGTYDLQGSFDTTPSEQALALNNIQLFNKSTSRGSILKQSIDTTAPGTSLNILSGISRDQ
jgi:hypothetical protein